MTSSPGVQRPIICAFNTCQPSLHLERKCTNIVFTSESNAMRGAYSKVCNVVPLQRLQQMGLWCPATRPTHVASVITDSITAHQTVTHVASFPIPSCPWEPTPHVNTLPSRVNIPQCSTPMATWEQHMSDASTLINWVQFAP